jgi:hypothetical protein
MRRVQEEVMQIPEGGTEVVLNEVRCKSRAVVMQRVVVQETFSLVSRG